MSTKRPRSPTNNDRIPVASKRLHEETSLQADGSASSQSSSLSHADYDIAWICALSLELAASRAMLDEEHNYLAAHNGDDNIYVLGRIAHHNIVMVALPLGYGKIKAANVSKDLKRSFPNIRATLMVGIGGGAPGEADLYLGDVVVGTRVMEYDLGKALQRGHFNCTETPKIPSALLRSALVNLQAKHGMDRSSLRCQELMRTKATAFPRPQQQDRLFQASYPHPPESQSCDACDASRLQYRQARPNHDFYIHYGVVASGDSVNKDSLKRDKVSRELAALCFEMEAAGIMDNLHCLPIRGICDYSDSHKNKVWQPYAAATAAAYARELLETIPANIKNHSQAVITPRTAVQYPASTDTTIAQRRLAWLEAVDFPQINARKDAIGAEQVKTCRWFLTQPKYSAWINLETLDTSRSALLWIRGKAGAGKSTLMKLLYSEVRKKKPPSTTVVSFFFNARGEYLEKSIVGMYRSLLRQVLTQVPDLQFVLDDMETPSTHELSSPSLNVVKDLFKDMIMALGTRSLICFIDALDECNENDVRDMVQFFEQLSDAAEEEMVGFRVCFASRPYPYIQVEDDNLLTLENEPGHAKDLAEYVRKCLKAPKKMQKELQQLILERSSGVFLWVVLVVGILNKESSHGGLRLRKRLLEIPPTLSKLFNDILKRDDEGPKELQRCILWVLCAFRPLTAAEFCHAMWAAGLDDGDVDEEVPDVQATESHMALITSSSKGLVEVANAKKKGSRVQFIHESVRDFLIKERGIQELWPDLGFAWEGASHELLRSYCESYLMYPAVNAYIAAPQDNGTPSQWTSEHKRMNAESPEVSGSDNMVSPSDNMIESRTTGPKVNPPKEYAFLEYASQHILEHANKAAASSVPQQAFLSRFFDKLGTRTLDCSQNVKARRYGSTANPNYIMADRGLKSLLELTLAADRSLDHDPALRFQHPFFAAMANGHKDAVALLLGLPSIIYKGESLLKGLNGISDVKRFTNRSPLSWACQEGMANLISALAHGKESLYERDPRGLTPIESITRYKVPETVRVIGDMCLSKGSDCFTVVDRLITSGHSAAAMDLIRTSKDWDETPASQAMKYSLLIEQSARHGFEDLVLRFIEKHANFRRSLNSLSEPAEAGQHHNVNPIFGMVRSFEKSPQSSRALSIASEHGRLAVVKVLLESGADIEAQGFISQTALALASSNRPEATVRLLLDRGPDIEARDRSKSSALTYASSNGHEAIVRLLLDYGVDIEARDDSKSSALTYASSNGHEAIVRLLLDCGADIEARDDSKSRPLARASSNGHEATVRLLLDYGADIEAKDDRSQRALHLASSSGHTAIVQLLLERGALIDAEDAHAQSALHLAACFGREATVQLLLAHGALVSANKRSVQPILFLALGKGYAGVVKILLDYGADVNDKYHRGQTALHTASWAGGQATVQLLLDHGVDDIDAQDDDGMSALMLASQRSNKAVVQLLIEYRASLDIVDKHGKTAIDVADRNGHRSIVDLLDKAASARQLQRGL